MKNFLAIGCSLCISTSAYASEIYIDQSSFYSNYENPIGIVDFSNFKPLKSPIMNVSNSYDVYHGESFINGVVFETRPIGNAGWVSQSVSHMVNGNSIYAYDIPYVQGERLAIQQYRPQYTLAIYSTNGFLGWVPELNSSNVDDFLIYFPENTQITKVEYGFTKKTASVSEPSSLVMLILGILGITLLRVKKSKS